MGNYRETSSLSPDEEASLLGDLDQETRNAVVRSTLSLKTDGDKIVFMKATLILTPSEMAQLLRLPEGNFRIPEQAKIPTRQDNPTLRDRFVQIMGVACFLDRVIKDPFSRDEFLRINDGIFKNNSPLKMLTETDAVLPAFSIINDCAKQWGSMYSERGPHQPSL